MRKEHLNDTLIRSYSKSESLHFYQTYLSIFIAVRIWLPVCPLWGSELPLFVEEIVTVHSNLLCVYLTVSELPLLAEVIVTVHSNLLCVYLIVSELPCLQRNQSPAVHSIWTCYIRRGCLSQVTRRENGHHSFLLEVCLYHGCLNELQFFLVFKYVVVGLNKVYLHS